MDPVPIGEVARQSAARMLRGEQPEHDRTYRRAYHTAVEDVILAVRQGATLADLIAHADKVQAWREQPWQHGRGVPEFERGA